MTAALDQRCMPKGVMFDRTGRPRERYVRVIHDGTSCVVTPCDVADLISDNPSQYTLVDVHLSSDEFANLPEFDGF